MKRLLWIVLLVSLTLIGISACASGDITVTDAWARPAATGQNSAVYFVVKNSTSADEKIVGVGGDAAKMIQTHETMLDADSVASMHHMPEIAVPAGGSIDFEPGGLHVMLMNLNADLKPGDLVTITLHFENHPDMLVEAEVRSP